MPVSEFFHNPHAGKSPSKSEKDASIKTEESSSLEQITAFHSSLENFMPTPLIPHPELAAELGVRQVFIKCETSRLGLPAYKILGASYAIYRYLGRLITMPGAESTTRSSIAEAAKKARTHLCCATDGNHGRAVAYMANLLGIPATVFVPRFVPQHTIRAIASEGKQDKITIVHVSGSYDDAETQALKFSFASPFHHLIQDNSFPELDDSIVNWIVAGYRTIFNEIDTALAHHKLSPTLFVVPVGVGSLAQSVSTHYAPKPGTHPSLRPKILTIEPTTAASLFTSLKAGEPKSVETSDTIMTGLNCGSVSTLAFPILKHSVDFAATVGERDAHEGVRELRDIGIDAGPIAGACVSALHGISVLGEGVQPLDLRKMGLDRHSVVVVIATEGRREYEEPNDPAIGWPR